MTEQEFLRLSDDAFWAPKLDLQPHIRRLMLSGTEALILDGPRTADIRTRTTLPVAALVTMKNETAFDWMFRDNVLVVACEPDRFQCLAAQADPPRRPIIRPPPRTLTPDMRGGAVGDTAVIDARERLQLPWRPGAWKLVLVTRALRSNPVRVVLHDGGAVAPAPAALEGAHLVLRGSGQELATVLDVELKVRASKAALGAGADVAVPVTFVLTGHAHPVPHVMQRAAPGRWSPAGAPEHVTASIRVALKDLLPAGVDADTYYVWAFAGDQVSAPVRVAVGQR